MEYRKLGDAGLVVSLLGLGGNTFGKHFTFGNYNDEAQSIALIHRAAELGINLIDTGDMYSAGVSEEYIGKAIAGRRADYVIASKVGLQFGEGPNDRGLSRSHILDGIEGSLRRLGTDYIDIYYAHKADPTTPIEETLRAFDDLVRDGKVRYIACSNYAGWQIAEAREVARQRGYSPFRVSQSPYSLLEREIEAEIIPACVHYGMSVIAYWPLAQGVLTGKYRRAAAIEPGTRAWQNQHGILGRQMSEPNLIITERLAAWAGEQGHSVTELALAWVAAKPFVCSVLTGVTNQKQLETNAQALEWKMSPDEVAEVARVLKGDA